MANQGEGWLLCSFYHESLHIWIKTSVNKFDISNHTASISGVQALRSYLKLICEYELHSLPNKKLKAQRIMVKITSRSDRPWSAIFCVIVYCRTGYWFSKLSYNEKKNSTDQENFRNSVVVAIFFLSTRSTKKSTFDWFKSHSLLFL